MRQGVTHAQNQYWRRVKVNREVKQVGFDSANIHTFTKLPQLGEQRG